MRWVGDERLLGRSLELMFSQATSALVSSGIAALVLFYTFWDKASPQWMLAWAACFCLVATYRVNLKSSFLKSSEQEKNNRAWFVKLGATIFVTGVLWGAFIVYLMMFAEGFTAAILLANFALLLAGSVTAYAMSMPIFAMFSVPMVFPAMLYLVVNDDQNSWMLAAVCLGWYLFMVSTARRFGEFAARSFGYEYENRGLVAELEEQNRRAEVLAQELMVLSNTDSLTGVYNRRYLDECIASELSRAHRTNGALSLLMCDVDFFKRYNDSLGHVDGDKCLKVVANILLESAREGTDVVARYGGEEFAVVLANTEADQAKIFAERLRKSVADKLIPHPDSDISKYLTISIGVSSLCDIERDSASDLIKRADKALYRAKECGRNQVQCQPSCG